MARVMITCPETGKPIYTHWNLDWDSLESIGLDENQVECPKCGQTHTWQWQDADLDETGGG